MTIFTTILLCMLLVFAAGFVTYLVEPRVVLDVIMRLVRSRARLTEKSVTVDGLTWPYLEGGPTNGEPVVLVHGFGADKDSWPLYARELTQKYRVIAPDLPGFGENTRDPQGDYGMGVQAHRLRAFLKAIGVEKCHLGGNSMGGFIALRFALDFPEGLHSLTLFNNAGVIGTDESDLQKEIAKGINPLEIQSVDDVTRLIAFVVHKPRPVPAGFRKVFFERYDEHREVLNSIFWAIAKTGLEEPLNDRLDGVTVPTLIVWGRHDQVLDVSSVDVLKAGIAGSEAVIFEDMAHVPMIENPSVTAAAHLPFLAKHAA